MTRGPHAVRVLVVAEHALVGESVRTALRARGLRPTVDRSEVGLLLTASAVGSAVGATMMGRTSIPWLVLAPQERGPSWEAFYAGGASLVVAPDASLETVCMLLHDLAASSLTGPGARL